MFKLGTIRNKVTKSLTPYPGEKYGIAPIQTIVKTKKVKIALISFGIDEFEEIEDDEYKLYKIPQNSLSSYKKTFLEAMKIASQEGAQFICSSELSYPGWDAKINNELMRLCKRKKSYIIAGSFHDENTFYNTSLIFTPYNQVHKIHKLKSAYHAGEKIKAPPDPKLINFTTEFGNFCVVICFDSYRDDVKNTFIHYQKDFRYQPIDFIFVPSYNVKPDEGRMNCRDLGNKTKSCIIYVNDLVKGNCSSVYMKKSIKLQTFKKTKKYQILFCTVNLETLRGMRKDLVGAKFVT